MGVLPYLSPGVTNQLDQPLRLLCIGCSPVVEDVADGEHLLVVASKLQHRIGEGHAAAAVIDGIELPSLLPGTLQQRNVGLRCGRHRQHDARKAAQDAIGFVVHRIQPFGHLVAGVRVQDVIHPGRVGFIGVLLRACGKRVGLSVENAVVEDVQLAVNGLDILQRQFGLTAVGPARFTGLQDNATLLRRCFMHQIRRPGSALAEGFAGDRVLRGGTLFETLKIDQRGRLMGVQRVAIQPGHLLFCPLASQRALELIIRDQYSAIADRRTGCPLRAVTGVAMDQLVADDRLGGAVQAGEGFIGDTDSAATGLRARSVLYVADNQCSCLKSIPAGINCCIAGADCTTDKLCRPIHIDLEAAVTRTNGRLLGDTGKFTVALLVEHVGTATETRTKSDAAPDGSVLAVEAVGILQTLHRQVATDVHCHLLT